jgi:DNA-binding response OmpR family regulator
VELAPTAFRFMALMGKRPGEVVSRNEIYDRLWPEMLSNPDSSSNPYDRQISDHKRKIATQIQKAVKGKAGDKAGADKKPDQDQAQGRVCS